MKRKLLRLLAWACALTLMMGMAATAAATAPQIAHVLVIKWIDENDAEGIRPDKVNASLGDTGVEVTKAGGWAIATDGAESATWSVTTPTGYDVSDRTDSDGITVITLKHDVLWETVNATAVWDDMDNANLVRPGKVTVQLQAKVAGEDWKNYGTPLTLTDPGWSGSWIDVLPSKNGYPVEYRVQPVDTPEFYEAPAPDSGTQVKYKLTTGTLQINCNLFGAPAGAPTGNLQIKIEGPDHRMPMTVNYSAFSGGSYTVEKVLPGAYLVTEMNPEYLIEEHYLVPEQTVTQDAVYVKAGTTGQTALKTTWTDTIPDRERNENPEASFGNLKFEIIGPDESLPMTITYADFTAGNYDLSHLKPGSYAVVERDADTLIDYYTLQLTDPASGSRDSITGTVFTVEKGEKVVASSLFNHYVPSLTPPPQEDLVDIPVAKVWDDYNDASGLRPDSIMVRLYQDGHEVDSRALTAANNWSVTFQGWPKYRIKDVEYVYSVNEDPVPNYLTAIDGTTITNTFMGQLTSASVHKVWNDNGNENGLRPRSVTMSLHNGTTVVARVNLNDANDWSATITDLPTVVDGVPAVYYWTEPEVAGYKAGINTDGNYVIFTNAPFERPPVPYNPPRIPGRPVYVFEEYETPLGVAVEINHVGDCFD